MTHPLLLVRVHVVAERLRLLNLGLAVAVLALRVAAVQRLLRLVLLCLRIGREPGLRVLVSRLLLAVVPLMRLLLALLMLGDLAGLIVCVHRSGRLGVLVFGSGGRGDGLRLLQVLVLLVVLLGEHALLLARDLALVESTDLARLAVESTLALSVDGLDREGVLLLLLRLLRDLRSNRLLHLRRGRLLSGWLLSLDRGLSNRGDGLSSLGGRRSLVFVQRLGGLARRPVSANILLSRLRQLT